MKLQIFAAALSCFCTTTVFAGHHQAGEKADHTSAAWQIEAYSTAAPAFLGEFATVLGSDGSVLRQGTNGWTCQSANPRPVPPTGWRSAHDAMAACHDGEGMKWMMGYIIKRQQSCITYGGRLKIPLGLSEYPDHFIQPARS